MSLMGKKISSIICSALVDGSIVDQYSLADWQGSYGVLFFYPLNFTFVCPTELWAFQEALPEFKKRGVHLAGCSIDSVHSHLAWSMQPRQKGGIQGISYPIIADIKKELTLACDLLKEEEGIAYRGTLIMDKNQIIRSVTINDLAVGRNIDETLRIIDALKHHEAHGEVCPAGWRPGGRSMRPDEKGKQDYFHS